MDGILVLNKPAGMTSFDVIARLRKKTGQKKFGHCGTLDPMASGVLVVLAGKACKALQFVSDTDKQYRASIALGAKYDTDDVSGTIEQTAPIRTDFDFEAVLASFVGRQSQRVPKAAAKKVDGKKLYEYLRAGQDVPDVYTDIEIYSIEPESRDDLSFTVSCSSGTYIRSLCRDFGERTCNLAAMKSLVRTRANGFSLDEAQDLDDELIIYPLTRLLALPQIQVQDERAVIDGRPLALECSEERVLLMDGEKPLAVYGRDENKEGVYRSLRGLF